MSMYTQTVAERYFKKKMKEEEHKLLFVDDWEDTGFCLKHNPDRVEGWGIHLDQDKVNNVYNHVAIFKVAILVDRWQCTGLSELGFISLGGG